MDDRTMQQQVAFLVRCLLEERKRTGGWLPPREPGADEPFGEQWDVFRALVNTREPYPAPEGFLAAQDALLRELVRRAGVTQVADLPPAAADARLSLWRGDITTLAVDAIVNAANAQMLGCWVPGHYCIDNAIHTFAGVQLRLECARLMGAQGHDEPTGRAKVTPAYNLPSRFVIHTVGPIAEGHPTDRHRLDLASSCAELPGSGGRLRGALGGVLLHQHRRLRLPAGRGGAAGRAHGARMAGRPSGRRSAGGVRRVWRAGRGSLPHPAVLTKASSASRRRCSRKAGRAGGRRRG